jgi:hypothetical protein
MNHQRVVQEVKLQRKKMKIKDKDLKERFQVSLRKEKPRIKGCPEIDELINTMSKESNEKEKLKIFDHISECSHCFKIFEAIKPFILEGKSIKTDLDEISLSELEVKELKQRAKEKISELKGESKKRGRVSIFSRVRLAYMSIAAALLVVVLGAVLILRGPDDFRQDIVRGQENEAITLVKPVGELKKPPRLFEWTPLPQAKEYQVKLLDKELTMVWTSERSRDTKALVPPELSESLKRQELYYWKVIVFMEDSTTKEFGLQEFKIQPDQ